MSSESLILKDNKYSLIDGTPLFRVTEVIDRILKPFAGFPKDPELLAYKGELGTAVHKAIEWDLRGELDHLSLEGVVRDYFEGWEQAKYDFKLETICSEKKLFNRAIGLAGTVDIRAFATIKGVRRKGTVDIKTSNQIWPHYKYQLGFYEVLWWNPGGTITQPFPRIDMLDSLEMYDIEGWHLALPKDNEFRMVILLKPDGSYKVDIREGHEDIQICMQMTNQLHESIGGWDPDAAAKANRDKTPRIALSSAQTGARPTTLKSAKKSGAKAKKPVFKQTKESRNIL